jgi:HEAT repeat protein
LSDPEPAVRATALGALARLGDLTLADVRAAAVDPAPAVRGRGAELGVSVGSDAAGTLVDLLRDPDATVVEAAAFGLGELGSAAGDDAVEALAEVAADHPDPLCREAAVAAIGAIGPTGFVEGAAAGVRAVLAAMADKPAVRRRAVLALAAFDEPEVEAALAAARADRDWQVRQAAEDLTGRRTS